MLATDSAAPEAGVAAPLPGQNATFPLFSPSPPPPPPRRGPCTDHDGPVSTHIVATRSSRGHSDSRSQADNCIASPFTDSQLSPGIILMSGVVHDTGILQS